MSDYIVTVPNGAQSFNHDGATYNSGDQFASDDACQVLAFYQSFNATNPTGGRTDGTPAFWQNIEAACPAGAGAAPPAAQLGPADESPAPPGSDSPGDQGAPEVPASTSGTETNASPPGTGDDASTAEEPTRPPAGEPDPDRSGEQPQVQINGGDPVDLFTGTVFLRECDLDIPEAIVPLSLERVYRSGPGFFGPLGWNWDHNHNLYLRELANGDIALWRLGHEDVFTWTGGRFEPPRGVFEELERVPGIPQTFEITAPEGVVTRFERPAGWIDGERVPILWRSDRHGNTLTYTYGGDDHLRRVEDDNSRRIDLAYDDCGLLVSAVDHTGRQFVYEHDEEKQHLVCVTGPSATDHPKGTSKRFFYEPGFVPPSVRHNLVRVEDDEGRVYLQNDYEQDPASWQFGRVVQQLYGAFLYQYRYTELQWVSPAAVNVNVHSVRAEVLAPDLSLETYTFNYRGDLLDQRFRLRADNSFRVVAWAFEYDDQGNRTVTTRPDGSQEIATYNSAAADPRMRGRLLRKELTAAAGFPSPSRIVWRGRYEPRYQLLMEETNETGATTKLKYDFDLTPGAPTNTGKLKEVIQPDATLPDASTQSARTTLDQNARGQVVAMILGDGVRNEFRYGNAGEERGRLVEEIRDVAGLAVSNRRTHDGHGFLSETIDGNGGVTRFAHNALGQLERIERPTVGGSAAEERYHYDADGHVVRVDRPKGSYGAALTDPADTHIIDEIERDVLGFATRTVLAANTAESRDVRFCNDYRGLAVRTTTPDGTVVTTEFDERRLPLSEEVEGGDGLRIESRRAYDRKGGLTRETDVHGTVTTYEYDGFSRLLTIALPNGSRRRFTWLPGDLLESEEVVGDDGLGNVRRLELIRHTYDEKSRRISTTRAAFTNDHTDSTDLTTVFFHDELDRVTKIVDHRGGETTRTYDGLGRLVAEVDPMGHEERTEYDGNGNVVRRTSLHREPSGAVTTLTRTFQYDARDRRTAAIEPDGASVVTVHDDRDLVVEETDRLGVVVRRFYDAFGAKIREIEDVGGLDITHEWVVDIMSRTTAYVDPTGEVTNYGFDSVGRLRQIDQPNGFSTTRIFNQRSQVVEETMGSGSEFTYTFDAANRVTRIVNSAAPAGIQQVQIHEFTYDGRDRLTRAAVGADEVLRTYDSQGRITSETTLGTTISCRYDDVLGDVEKVWPDGRTDVLSHDLNGVLTTIAESASGALGAGVGLHASFRTSGPGALGDTNYRGATTVTNTYDDRKRLVEISAQSPAMLTQRIEYRYDAGNVRRIEALDGETTKTSYFEFDARSRLRVAREGFATTVAGALTQPQHDAAIAAAQAASAGAAHVEDFTYDDADERLTHAETGALMKNYSYAPGHRIQSDGATAYAFHPDGTLASAGATSFDVDALGRITAARSGPTTTLTLAYDALGRPSAVTEAGQPDRTFNYLGGFVEQESENGQPARQVTLHPVTGVPIAYHSNAGTHYALVDARFSLLGLADVNGAMVERYTYSAFGMPEIFDAGGASLPVSAFGIQPLFGGQRYLTTPGLYLSKRRLMDPRHGLFLAADPKGYVDSPMLYAYAAQDPVNKIDPNGDIIPFIIAAFVIGGALAGAGYSAWDAYHNPNRYEGVSGSLRVLGNVFGGAIIGGTAVVAGEALLAVGGTGIFASGTAATSLTAGQAFVLYGTSAAASGSVLRYGFNSMFPEYVDPVTPRTIAFDYLTGGGIGAAVRMLAPAVGSGVSSTAPRSWGRYWTDVGGEAPITGQLGPYPGKIGQLLDKIGIRQGYQSNVINNDLGGSWFARTDTAVHEGFHAFVARYFPTFRNLSHGNRIWAAAARYPEEVLAYAFGHGGALRPHGIPFAPIEAFNSLRPIPGGGGYTVPQFVFAKAFWGTAWLTSLGYYAGVGEALAQPPPTDKPPAAK